MPEKESPKISPTHVRLLHVQFFDPAVLYVYPRYMTMTTASRVLAPLFAALLCSSLPASETTVPAVSVPRFQHPGAGKVFYFVLTDRFANGNIANDTGGIQGGRNEHGFDPSVISHYHGGDFVGMTAKLDYIQGLGVTAIWITPPFVNKAVQEDSAAYHGYWITDFTRIDPHLGTESEFSEFVKQAHARGIRVYLDIVANHSANVINYGSSDTRYRSLKESPLRDASGKAFDFPSAAWNGVGEPKPFPSISPEAGFPIPPRVSETEAGIKRPAWLNNVALYHNRGNSLFVEESSLHGDFVGLDDLCTEHPEVVKGFIEVYGDWMTKHNIDGFRIDTVKHVNMEFWQAFGPAIREHARQLGRPDFFQFGEVANESGDLRLLSTFSTRGTLDSTLDFGFFAAARDYISRGAGASVLTRLFADDDLYTDHDSNSSGLPTFVSNHDAGRLGHFLRLDNPGMPTEEIARRVVLAHGLLLTTRGQPVLYYGDEQGMTGTGNDMAAREDMFPSQAKGYRELSLLGTNKKGTDDKFDKEHPFYRFVRALAGLRTQHPALAKGALIPRQAQPESVFAFSRVERNERIEYLVALNNSLVEASTCLPTSQGPDAVLTPLFDSHAPEHPKMPSLTTNKEGSVSIKLAPLQLAVWRAEKTLKPTVRKPSIRFEAPLSDSTLAFSTRLIDGITLGIRQELNVSVEGGDSINEVTFLMTRASRPGQYELLGVDDAPPYRHFWSPPSDLLPNEELSFIATVSDLRGGRHAARIDRIKVVTPPPVFGTAGAIVPHFTQLPEENLVLKPNQPAVLSATVEGTGPLEYQWLRNGERIEGANTSRLQVSQPGLYLLQVHNRESTVLSRECQVRSQE